MIDPEKRKAIFLLHQEGMSGREIARRLHLCRQAVAAIIAQKGQLSQRLRATKNAIDPELLRRLYAQCEGWIQRVHEKLAEEHLIKVKYSTLTRMLRNLGISTSPQTRCSRVPDEPGAEMQHDTTVYQVKLGDQTVRLVATILYLRYSKRRYLKFYRTFNRFQLTFWRYFSKSFVAVNGCFCGICAVLKRANVGGAAVAVRCGYKWSAWSSAQARPSTFLLNRFLRRGLGREAKSSCRLRRCICRRVRWRVRQLAMACLSHSYCSLDRATHTVLPLTLRVQG